VVANHQGGEHQGRISRHEAPTRSRTDLDKICYSVIPCFPGYYRRVMRLRNRRSSVYFFANKSGAFKNLDVATAAYYYSDIVLRTVSYRSV
jgi:hypothetical protein